MIYSKEYLFITNYMYIKQVHLPFFDQKVMHVDVCRIYHRDYTPFGVVV